MKNAIDWKDALSALNDLPAGEPSADESDIEKNETSGNRQHGTLHVVMEKKGRGGKIATIIEGFEISDEEIDAIARSLRKRLGTGGSARGGEILIQGDRKADVVRMLREMGYKAN